MPLRSKTLGDGAAERERERETVEEEVEEEEEERDREIGVCCLVLPPSCLQRSYRYSGGQSNGM